MEHIKEALDKFLEQIKPVLNFEEACKYCGISASSMYKHTSANRIPHYKPEGKLIYFKRDELDEWMLRNRQSTNQEMAEIATSYTFKNRKS
ncbi:helix-turn-helix domain-containing protein [Gelidibacter japonicus]|uniref:helix-turn-helix domain-containing protein n=1 Tax=Gelidibacter japonicus TaxID=1962232 RepID=UPI003A95D880